MIFIPVEAEAGKEVEPDDTCTSPAAGAGIASVCMRRLDRSPAVVTQRVQRLSDMVLLTVVICLCLELNCPFTLIAVLFCCFEGQSSTDSYQL